MMCRSTATLGAEAGVEGSTTPVDHLPAVAQLAGGTRLGRYVVAERLGSGGMGVVHAAYDPVLDRRIAVKLLRPDRSTEHLRARMLREARAMARLSHPNVMPIYDVGVHEDQVFIAMELVCGSPLRRKLDAATPWREVIGAYVQAARGLDAAHAAGFVHRDFKPDNVLCGDDGRVRVADFGLVELEARASRWMRARISSRIAWRCSRPCSVRPRTPPRRWTSAPAGSSEASSRGRLASLRSLAASITCSRAG